MTRFSSGGRSYPCAESIRSDHFPSLYVTVAIKPFEFFVRMSEFARPDGDSLLRRRRSYMLPILDKP